MLRDELADLIAWAREPSVQEPLHPSIANPVIQPLPMQIPEGRIFGLSMGARVDFQEATVSLEQQLAREIQADVDRQIIEDLLTQGTFARSPLSLPDLQASRAATQIRFEGDQQLFDALESFSFVREPLDPRATIRLSPSDQERVAQNQLAQAEHNRRQREEYLRRLAGPSFVEPSYVNTPAHTAMIAPGHIFMVSDPEHVGRIPVRTELEVLAADNPAQRTLGRAVRETIGVAVVNPRGLSRLSVASGEESRSVLPPVRRVEFPLFELSQNPSISLGDIRERRFGIIDRQPTTPRSREQMKANVMAEWIFGSFLLTKTAPTPTTTELPWDD